MRLIGNLQVCEVCECGLDSCKSCTKRTECHDCNLAGRCCCSDSHIAWHSAAVRKGIFLEYISLGWMFIEVIFSIIAGLIVGRSFALLAFGGDSLVELLSASVVLSYLLKLRHCIIRETESERIEKIAATLLIALIPVISLGAVYSYFSGKSPEASSLGIGVSLGAVVIMPILWKQKKNLGSQAHLVPVSIDAAESATCFFMSVAVLVSLLLNFFLHIAWVDYVATAVILGFVTLEIHESIEQRGL
jgi:divalent metal cation (Fe/Co/Zn/Cd) transporter